jgi:uncharacterized damage-inducible protein DinB
MSDFIIGLSRLIAYRRETYKGETFMLPTKLYGYLLIDLESAPDVLARLLAEVSDPAIWDRRPDPERFTLREVVAHLADWDQVFLGRLMQTRDADNPVLQGLDEGQVARDNDYAHADPAESLTRHAAGRAETVRFLRGLSPEQWARVGSHTELGPITLESQAALIAFHDGYHRQQVLYYVSLFQQEGKEESSVSKNPVKEHLTET